MFHLEKKDFIRNQIVCKQGDPSLQVFIVSTGVFETGVKTDFKLQ